MIYIYTYKLGDSYKSAGEKGPSLPEPISTTDEECSKRIILRQDCSFIHF